MTLTQYLNACKTALTATFPNVLWYVGVDEPDVATSFVWFAPAIGPGLATEWVTDIRGMEVTAVGDQMDFAGAETLAYAVDRWILGEGGSRLVAGERVINVNRSGGPPYSLLHDNAERTHFVCGYLYEVYSGLAPV